MIRNSPPSASRSKFPNGRSWSSGQGRGDAGERRKEESCECSEGATCDRSRRGMSFLNQDRNKRVIIVIIEAETMIERREQRQAGGWRSHTARASRGRVRRKEAGLRRQEGSRRPVAPTGHGGWDDPQVWRADCSLRTGLTFAHGGRIQLPGYI